ncbi:MAG: GGDEF domain-containing protein [Nitrosomonadales bacterium]|nr:MAG: GGDEF domain-containing protein [Nitrosomonadales bacterium]
MNANINYCNSGVNFSLNAHDFVVIEKSRLFRDISLESIEYLLNICQVIEFSPGNQVLSLNKFNSCIYIVLTGHLGVHLEKPDSMPHIVFEEGDCFGEMSIIDGKPVSAYVIAKNHCRLLMIHQEALWSLINVSHGVARNILYVLAGRIRFDNESLITGSKKQEESEREAYTDGLTGLHNRRWLSDSFKRQMQRCERSNLPCTVVMLDIDHFKEINDRHGHIAGDRILCTVAQVLLNTMRPADLISRYGGEEFALCLPDTSKKDCSLIAERLRAAIAGAETPFEEGRVLPAVTVSIGIAQMEPGQTLDTLISNADSALYRAKAKGRNCISE